MPSPWGDVGLMTLSFLGTLMASPNSPPLGELLGPLPSSERSPPVQVSPRARGQGRGSPKAIGSQGPAAPGSPGPGSILMRLVHVTCWQAETPSGSQGGLAASTTRLQSPRWAGDGAARLQPRGPQGPEANLASQGWSSLGPATVACPVPWEHGLGQEGGACVAGGRGAVPRFPASRGRERPEPLAHRESPRAQPRDPQPRRGRERPRTLLWRTCLQQRPVSRGALTTRDVMLGPTPHARLMVVCSARSQPESSASKHVHTPEDGRASPAWGRRGGSGQAWREPREVRPSHVGPRHPHSVLQGGGRGRRASVMDTGLLGRSSITPRSR